MIHDGRRSVIVVGYGMCLLLKRISVAVIQSIDKKMVLVQTFIFFLWSGND